MPTATFSRSLLASVAATFLLAACSDQPTAPLAETTSSLRPSAASALSASAAPDASAVGLPDKNGRSQTASAGSRQDDVIPGEFIVIFNDDVSDAPGLAQRLANDHRGTVRRTFEVFKGFSANLPEAAVEALKRNPNVRAIEPNRTVQLAGATQSFSASSGQPWGLDRLDQVSRPLSWTYYYSATGAGVNAYIIDSGIRTSHGEFGGRARNLWTMFGDTGDDCNGHGTHVAGTVGGATYGVAKQVRLYGVKVLNCAGSGSNEGIVAGIDWVYRNKIHPAVANISIQTSAPVASIDIATTNLVNSGVFVAVAAGNYNIDACQSSPARAAGTFTVGATTSTDARWTSSNWGTCVDGYAPGANIRSAGLATYSVYMNGTSMAAPHAAGVAAMIKQTYGNLASATIVSTLKSWSTVNIISGGGYGGSPNRLLYKGGL
jgi:aqualysin 1